MVLAAAGALAGLACSDSDSPAETATPGQTRQATTAASPATTGTSPAATRATPRTAAATTTTAPTATAATPRKVSANNATRAELQAAFEAAGIPGAAQWAREVVEYRPYPENDPNMAKLRQELAKYNPAAGVVDQIIATLSLP